MHYKKLIQITLVLALNLGFQIHAYADSEYPAAYFEPYIVYQAPEIVAAAAVAAPVGAAVQVSADTQAETNGQYPAANFEPYIVFQDLEAIASRSSSQANSVSVNTSPISIPSVTIESNASVAVVPSKMSADALPVSGFGIMLALFAVVYGLSSQAKNENVKKPADDLFARTFSNGTSA